MKKKVISTEKVLKPKINNPKLTKEILVTDENKKKIKMHSIVERPLTLFLNEQEIVTMMTICDYPKYLAIGYLLNQNMLKKNDKITSVDYDEEISTVVVRTKIKTNYEEKLKKKTLTSGCAQGTVFGDIMEEFEEIKLSKTAKIRASWGQLGNQDISDLYGYQSLVGTGRNVYSFGGVGVSGAYYSVSNQNRTWETSTMKNLGIDLSFFKRKLDVTFEVFDNLFSFKSFMKKII